MNDKAHEVARLWTLAQPAVSAFIASMVRNIHARDDILQDVAVAVLDSFGSYDPSRPFVAWAIGVARNQVRLYLRRQSRDRLSFDQPCLITSSEPSRRSVPRDLRMLDYLDDCVASLEQRGKRLCELR